jgi:DNA-binding transcriptional MerR regulator
MRIGEVHALLRQEFPTIELSKIRYYEDKGLVRPARSRKGYRLYSPTDVECLREAFRLAQNEFFPLKVIRQRLMDKGLLGPESPTVAPARAAAETASNVVSLPVPRDVARETTEAPVTTPRPRTTTLTAVPTPPPEVGFGATGAIFTRTEFLSATGLCETTLVELEEFGFVAPRGSAGDVVFDENDLAIARRAGTLLERGVDVRHLQPLKRTVDRQVDLLGDLTAPLRQGGAARRGLDVRTEATAVASELQSLRDALLERALAEYLGR